MKRSKMSDAALDAEPDLDTVAHEDEVSQRRSIRSGNKKGASASTASRSSPHKNIACAAGAAASPHEAAAAAAASTSSSRSKRPAALPFVSSWTVLGSASPSTPGAFTSSQQQPATPSYQFSLSNDQLAALADASELNADALQQLWDDCAPTTYSLDLSKRSVHARDVDARISDIHARLTEWLKSESARTWMQTLGASRWVIHMPSAAAADAAAAANLSTPSSSRRRMTLDLRICLPDEAFQALTTKGAFLSGDVVRIPSRDLPADLRFLCSEFNDPHTEDVLVETMCVLQTRQML